MIKRQMPDEEYAKIRESLAKIPTENTKYPCTDCKRHGFEPHNACKEWNDWFSEVWPIVTGRRQG